MKEAELRKAATCGLCGKKILEAGVPIFWRVTIENFGVDLNAVRRQAGLTMMLGGNATIAAAMGPDENMAKPLGAPSTITVCAECCTKSTCVAAIQEAAAPESG